MDIEKTRQVWDNHYNREKSRLTYPDENLVRLLAKLRSEQNTSGRPWALDLGAGSGRHSLLLESLGYQVTAIDYSSTSLENIRSISNTIDTVELSSPPYPFGNETFEVVVAWGVLHYNPDFLIREMVADIYRILKAGGSFLGTIRSQFDTFLEPNSNHEMGLEDLKGGSVRLFRHDELETILSGAGFSRSRIGLMERTPLDQLDKRISHYYFQSTKQTS